MWIICCLALTGCGREAVNTDHHLDAKLQLSQVAEQYGSRPTDVQAQAYVSIRPAKGDRASISIRLDIDLEGNCRIQVDKAVAIVDGVWYQDGRFTLLLLRDNVAVVDQADAIEQDLSGDLLPLLLRQIPTLIEQLQYGPVPPAVADEWQDDMPVWHIGGDWRSSLLHEDGVVRERRWLSRDGTTVLHARYSSELIRDGLKRPQQWRLAWHDGSKARVKMSSWGKRERRSSKVHTITIPKQFERLNVQQLIASLQQAEEASDAPTAEK